MKRLWRHPLSWIFLLGLGLRLAHLTFHSLWFDEVMSTFWAARPAGEIWRVGMALVQDKHPPLYYLLLHYWTGLVGGSDFAVRSLGAAIGALAVLPAYGIGRRLGGPRGGAFAALLVAMNPFLVWYSQEARMFMPATTFALVGLYGILQVAHGEWRAPDHHCPRLAGVFYLLLAIAGFTAALYSYLYSAFLMPVAGAWLLVARWERRRQPGVQRDFWFGVIALFAVSILFVPVAWSAWRVSGAEAVPGRPFEGMFPALATLLKVYSFGWPPWGAGWMAALTLGAGTLALTGCVVPSPNTTTALCCRRALNGSTELAEVLSKGGRAGGPTRRFDRPFGKLRTPLSDRGGLYLIIWLAVVILIGGALLGRDGRVFAEARYQIALVLALCLAWGRALAWLWAWKRPTGLVGIGLLMGLTALALPFNWAPENRREAWREVAAFIETHAGPHDAVLIQPDYVRVAYDRYADKAVPVFVPFTDKLSDPAQVAPPLEGLATFESIWVIQSHHQDLDPRGLVLGWFAARYPLITEVFPAGIAIHAYAQHYRTPSLPAGVHPLDGAPESGGLRLRACSYSPAVLRAGDDLFHPPSAWIHVTTYWRAEEPLTADLRPRIRMVDASGQVWGESLAREGDVFRVWPTSRWVPGEVVRADHDINLNPSTPRGMYRVIVQAPEETGQIGCGSVEIN